MVKKTVLLLVLAFSAISIAETYSFTVEDSLQFSRDERKYAYFIDEHGGQLLLRTYVPIDVKNLHVEATCNGKTIKTTARAVVQTHGSNEQMIFFSLTHLMLDYKIQIGSEDRGDYSRQEAVRIFHEIKNWKFISD